MTIGNQLKKARQKKQVTLEQVYAFTKIQPDTLSALEGDNFHAISNSIYVKSFLKEYAKYLGLDVNQIMAEYAALSVPKASLDNKVFAENNKTTASRPLNTNFVKGLRPVFAGVLIIIILLFSIRFLSWVKQGVQSWNRHRIEQSNALKSTQQQDAKIPVQIPVEKPSTAQGAILIPQNEKLNLTITATDDVWMELKRDETIIFKSVFKKGIDRTWQADDSFELWTGNASVMQLKLNGHDLVALGRGVKRGIIIDRQGIRK
jgi:cytoskeleton protein RodZ